MKQWLPPHTNSNVRRCRVDGDESVISTCPEKYRDWNIANLCETEPTSFVYEDDLTSLLGKWQVLTEIGEFESVGDEITQYHPGRKFKNSYCASCNAAGWLGCRLKKSFERHTYIHNDSISNYIRYHESVHTYMFVFRTDLNQRTCSFDSDGFITSPNFVTGLDTCKSLSERLQSCACDSVFDFSSQSCVRAPHLKNATCPINPADELMNFELSKYAKEICNFVNLQSNASLCLSHRTNRSSFVSFFDKISGQPIDQCHSTDPIGCQIPENETICIREYSGVSSTRIAKYFPSEKLYKIPLQNSVAISYEPVDHDFALAQRHIEVEAGLDILFDLSLIVSTASCSGFSTLNYSLSSLLVCPNHSLVHYKTAEVFSDYLLQHNATKVCTQYAEIVFKLNIYHYVLCGLSALCLLVYIVWYFLHKKISLTGNFFLCQLSTLLLALLSYCFIVRAKNVPALCRTVTCLVQYLFLSVHCWTNVLATWMFKGLSSTRLVKTSGKKEFITYSMYGWLSPLPFVALSFLLDAFPVDKLYPVFSDSFCFLASGWIRVLVFTGPIYVQIFIDVGLCIGVAIFIWRSGKGLASNQSNRRRIKMKIVSLIKLLIIFGIQWVLLFFTEIDSPNVNHLWTALNVLVALQGVLVVLALLLNRKNIERLSNFARTRRGVEQTKSSGVSEGSAANRMNQLKNSAV